MTERKKDLKFILCLAASGVLALLFVIIAVAAKFTDVAPIGPESLEIGLSTINGYIFNTLGENEFFYNITEIFGLVAIAVMGGFALVGLIQLIRRKSLKAVDIDIWLLAALYVLMAAFYVLFEIVVVNYRPVLVDGEPEASFPSSHTMLVLTVFGSAIYQFAKRICQSRLWIIPTIFSAIIMLFTVIGRLASGVHWFSDILAGVCLAGAMVFAYIAICFKKSK